MTDLIKNIGIENARKYGPVFNQVKRESDQDYEGISRELSRTRNGLEHIERLLSNHFNALLMVLDKQTIESLKIKELKEHLEDFFKSF